MVLNVSLVKYIHEQVVVAGYGKRLNVSNF